MSSTQNQWMAQCGCLWHMSVARFCPLRELNLRDGNQRLKTFSLLGWPIGSTINPVDAAEAGFFYTGQSDILKCFECGVSIHNWEAKDNPVHEHIKFSRYCPFTLGLKSSGNVPILEDPYKDVNKQQMHCFDVID